MSTKMAAIHAKQTICSQGGMARRVLRMNGWLSQKKTAVMGMRAAIQSPILIAVRILMDSDERKNENVGS
jgi:hypothetical protein